MYRTSGTLSKPYNGYCIGSFFLFEQSYSYFKTVYNNLFSNGTAKGAAVAASSGIENFGWYASIVIAAERIEMVEFVEQMNVHKWFNFMSIKRAENLIKQS